VAGIEHGDDRTGAAKRFQKRFFVEGKLSGRASEFLLINVSYAPGIKLKSESENRLKDLPVG